MKHLVLELAGFVDFAVTEAQVAGRPGTRLDCAKRDAGRVWAVSEYFVARGDVHCVLGRGSSVPEEDEALFSAIVEQFEIWPEEPRRRTDRGRRRGLALG